MVDTLTCTNTGPTGLSAGDVCVVDASAALSVQRSTMAEQRHVFGVAIKAIQRTGRGAVAVLGAVTVNVTGDVAPGDALQASLTAGKAQTGSANAFALATAASSSGQVTAVLLGTGLLALGATIADPTLVSALAGPLVVWGDGLTGLRYQWYAAGTPHLDVQGTFTVNAQGAGSQAGLTGADGGVLRVDATVNASPGLLVSGDPPATADTTGLGSTTGLGNGAAANLQAPAQGTGTGPAGLTVIGWVRLNLGTTVGWCPVFQ